MTAPDADLTIDQLAARAGMTVRNIRSHVSRGLLPPPQLRGRTAYYDAEHLARLQLIAGLQQEGFSLAAIEAVVRQTPARSAEQALTFYRGILAPWQPEDPEEMLYSELAEWLGIEPEPTTLERLHAAGLLEPLGADRVRITNPALVRAGAQTVRLGIPVDAVLALRPELIRHVRAISELFVALFRDTVWREHVARGMPNSELAEVRRIVEALQPVAAQALLAAFRSAMPEAIEAFVREQLAGGAGRNGR
ncbi:MAG: MerR family transcriptional regulator [Pseudonocardiaceae bacterium]